MEFGLLFDGLKKAFQSYIHNIVAYLVGIILFLIISAVVYFIGFGGDILAVYEALINMKFGTSFVIMILTVLIGYFISAPLMYGMYYMAIKGTRSKDVKIGDLFYGFKSGKAFVRSLIYVLVYAVVIAVVSLIVGVLVGLIAGAVSLASASAAAAIAGVLTFILMLLVEIFFFFTIYVYVMTPGEGFFYALKESFRIGKSNIIMTLLTIIIVWIISIFVITIPLGYLYGAYMLKELDPSIKDESGMEDVV
ncbi:hypothetical protein MmiAt1_09180 [Methanimicrococcus sp. At1]|uniref:Glycerophosphoryl diester phosphodiesterase membrane domain-containing protein n=1 Tax=Methanimicrococcus hacksteinii TaxID=3028293 RepID=A0ABU3VPW1_9EURY|nr:hypothetical protein [Methanimicrococcus sp. At1]MDV0445344.1 hypothetical protein [Methanimicrococcus sp. At1]